jgi:orotidine-5'-phosphate decarboxylase
LVGTPLLSDARSRLIFALDYPDMGRAGEAAAELRGHVGVVKVGLELFVAHGPEAVALGATADAEVFLDLKLHDIPATVAGAVRSAGRLGVRYLTVHASGGSAMLKAAVEAAASSPCPPRIVAVTVLTSLHDDDLDALGMQTPSGAQAQRWAELAYAAGVRAFVCSPAEAHALRQALGAEAEIITPGVRPSGTDRGDQKRVMTPAEAMAAGADALVVGRPIRDAADRAAAADRIVAEMADALGAR